MDTATKPPLVSRIGALTETGIDFSSAPDEARTTLHSLRQEYPELRKFLEHRFARFSAAQQQVVLALLEAAPASDLARSAAARESLRDSTAQQSGPDQMLAPLPEAPGPPVAALRRSGQSGAPGICALWVFLTQAVESGPGLIWRAAEVDTGLCQSANPGHQRGFRCSIHA